MSSRSGKRFLFVPGIEPLLDSIESAKEFIKIVSFQLTSERIIEALEKACQRGLKVSAITLPPDSYAGDRAKVEALFHRLRSAGVDLSLCIWEVGEPRLTPTSLSGAVSAGIGEKWYSLHSKFLVTDSSALMSSSNCTDEDLLECYLQLQDSASISQFANKFQFFKKTFTEPSEGFPHGSLLYLLPRQLQTEVQMRFMNEGRLLVKEYPADLCATGQLNPSLIVSPFEGRARDILVEMIEDAKRFLFLTSERFFDEELTECLAAKLRKEPIQLKILSGPPQNVRQNPAKARAMLERILAAGGEYASLRNIHAKLWVNEAWLVIGSPNLTKMNLGFATQNNRWRADTQVLYLQNDKSLIEEAASEFLQQFNNSRYGISVLADVSSKIQAARHRFRSVGLKCSYNAATLMARLESYFSIEALQKADEISILAARLVRRDQRHKVEERHVAMAAILLLLRERRHQQDELVTKLSPVLTPASIDDALKGLTAHRLVKRTRDGLVIDLDTLIEDENDRYLLL